MRFLTLVKTICTKPAVVFLLVSVVLVEMAEAADAVDNTFETGWNEEIRLSADDILGNDSGDGLSVISVQDALNGSLRASRILPIDRIRFTPDEDFSGIATFTYTIQDSSLNTDTATVWVCVDSPGCVVDQEPPVITSGATSSFAENNRGTAHQVTAVDNVGVTDYYLDGVDADWFTIYGVANITFNAPPDFENPLDVDGDNIYQITVTVSDAAANTDFIDIMITVTDVDEVPPTIDPSVPTTIEFLENTVGTVVTVWATDDVGVTAYTLEGPDADSFSIDDSGNTSFDAPPDFENPLDANGDNTYELTVEVSDAATNTDFLDIMISVTDDMTETIVTGNVYWLPTLQSLTDDGVVITWTTVQGGDSRVDFSLDNSIWTTEADAADTGERVISELGITLHEVVLSGLYANTLYHYKIFVDGTEQASGFSFKTAPASTTSTDDVNFIVIGDYGVGNSAPMRDELRDILVRDARGLLLDSTTGELYGRPNFITTVGDNVYTDGTYEEWDTKHFQEYGDLTSRAGFFPSIGDHDYEAAATAWELGNWDYLPAQYDLLEHLPGPSASEEATYFPGLLEEGSMAGHNYSFDFGNVHVAVVDYQYRKWNGGIVYEYLHGVTGNGEDNILAWLEADLQAAAAAGQWLIVINHQVYFRAGASNEWYSVMRQMYEDLGVNLAFSGNTHHHERTWPMYDGESMTGAGDEAFYPTYIIAGGGAKNSEACSGGTYVAYSLCGNSDSAMYARVRTYESDAGQQCIEVRGIDHNGVTQDTFDYCKP